MNHYFAKKFQLETEIRATKQGQRSIQELYDFMVKLWDQMARLEPNDLIKSNNYRKFQEENQLIQFLLALSDKFEPFKRSLLRRRVVPSLQEVVLELKTEEARLSSSSRYCKGKFAVDDDGDVPEEKIENHEAELSGGIVAKFAAASLAVAGVSWALSDYLSGSGSGKVSLNIFS
ncbi:hypothetical protein M9H77_25558 [Catharanthus roseus]|uniref:Uncharacterized protein n=1 Tax=Catharanthus roseus TaxID=4058 RepID=A0ACC0A930_CATRO|nr:hypothetical protein M9H77_25558 [Catharanthus roseus]